LRAFSRDESYLTLLSPTTPNVIDRRTPVCPGFSISTANIDASRASTASRPHVLPLHQMKQRRTTPTRLWGRYPLQDYEDDMVKGKHSQPLLHSLYAGNKKTATIATLALLVSATSAAFPAISHAVDLTGMYGGVITIASSTSSLFSKLTETGFYQAFSLVFLSEIGDKTFFIAGLLAMKTSRIASFVGSMGALTVMTLLSVVIGQIFHVIPSGFGDGVPLDDIAACIAFAFFGFKTLKDALAMEEGASAMDEELAEAEEEVENSESVKKTTAW
jgi:Uncharacterized protein family UPF0016